MSNNISTNAPLSITKKAFFLLGLSVTKNNGECASLSGMSSESMCPIPDVLKVKTTTDPHLKTYQLCGPPPAQPLYDTFKSYFLICIYVVLYLFIHVSHYSLELLSSLHYLKLLFWAPVVEINSKVNV